MLRFEPRPEASRLMSVVSPLLALAITVVIGTCLFVVLGKDPVKALQVFFVEPVKSLYALSELAMKATPLLLIALGLSVCFRSNVWNIGAEGQFILGAVFAGGVAMQAGPATSHWIVVPILLAGVLGGMCWAAIVALLRDRFNANEILVSLMLVYVADMVLNYLVYGPWKDPAGYNFPQTITFAAATRIPRLVDGFRTNIGAILALLAVAGFWVLLFRTYLGFQLQVGGLALAGPIGQLTPHVPAGYGFAAIIVAYVGRLHPVGTVFSAVLMSMFYIGGELAQSRLGLPKSLTGVFQGLLLFTLLACDTLIHYRVRWVAARRSPRPGGAAAAAAREA
jgi:general nucleoside transport system permease protein